MTSDYQMDLGQRIVTAAILVACLCFGDRDLGAQDGRIERVQAVFSTLDQNGDGKLNFVEFAEGRKRRAAAQRDFRLFDRDQDQYLTPKEFASIPGAVPLEDREPTSDPIIELVDQLMSAMDRTFDDWNENPKLEINLNQFTRTVQASFKNANIRLELVPADLNLDQKVSRSEARQFLEIQMGVRTDHGTLLRQPNGQILNYGQFRQYDLDHNDQLDILEFEKSIEPGTTRTPTFQAANTDGNHGLSLEEWGRLGGGRIVDPIEEFLQIDADCDGLVSRGELAAHSPAENWDVLKKTFPAFDLDRDGKLSLAEYRVTMGANPAWNWYRVPADQNNDGHLDFAEFVFEGTSAPLLRLMYFKQFDLNSDQRLEPHEFPLRIMRPNEFFTLNEDGSELRLLWGFDGHPILGSPAVSPDSKWLAFDDSTIGEPGSSQIYVAPIEGGTPRKICSGMMPSWSADGRFLACARRAPHFGVWLVDVASKDLELVLQSHWGQLSPDGKLLLADAPNFLLYDLETESKKTVLAAGANPFVKIFPNGTWSPDSTHFCFKGRDAENQLQIATVGVAGNQTGPAVKIHYTFAVSSITNFAWHPRGDRIVFSMPCLERDGLRQLYEFDPHKAGSIKLVAGQDETRNNTDACWTPDGKRLIFTSGDFCDD